MRTVRNFDYFSSVLEDPWSHSEDWPLAAAGAYLPLLALTVEDMLKLPLCIIFDFIVG